MLFMALSSPLAAPPVMVVSVMLCLIVSMLLLQRLTMGIVLRTKMKFPAVHCIGHKAVIPLVNS